MEKWSVTAAASLQPPFFWGVFKFVSSIHDAKPCKNQLDGDLSSSRYSGKVGTNNHELSPLCSAGDAPRIVAKGGFSGVFPDSSSAAYSFALSTSAPDTTLWCDVQLTKDGVGVCLRDINMQNCTNVAQAYTARKRTYVIDGVRKTGWFASDFTMAELQSVVCEYNSATANFHFTIEQLVG